MYLGIDIGGTSVKAAACEKGRWLWTGQSPPYAKPTTTELKSAIRAAVDGRAEKIRRVGLCVPGVFDDAGKKIVIAVNVPGLVGMNLDSLVPEALGAAAGVGAMICNDAEAAAHDIHRSRGLRGRLLLLAVGTGIGAAVLDDGKPLHVEGDSPGHLGQIDVSIPAHPAVGPDGGAGGLEGYLGVAALKEKYGPDFSGALANFTASDPPLAALVRAIRICHAIYRPNHVCLCGGIGIRLRHLLPPLFQAISSNLTSLARPDWTLTCGDDDFHAARGAAISASSIL